MDGGMRRLLVVFQRREYFINKSKLKNKKIWRNEIKRLMREVKKRASERHGEKGYIIF